MWRTPVGDSESSTASEDMEVYDEELSTPTTITTPAIAEDSPNNELLTSSAADVHYISEVPYFATLVPKVCTCENIVEMSTNFQSRQNRIQNRIHFRNMSPRRRPYRRAYCHHRNIQEEADFNLEEEPSFIPEFPDNSMLPIREEHLLVLAENDPINFESGPSNTEIESNSPNLIEFANDVYMNHVAQSLLDSALRSRAFEVPRPLDPFQLGNESLSPFIRIIRSLPLPTLRGKILANHLIKLSRHLTLPDGTDLYCLNCNRVPISPVTGECGHSRCLRCIELNGNCPCGVLSPKKLNFNTLMRDITQKIRKYIKLPTITNADSVTGLSTFNRGVRRSTPRRVQYMISRNSATATSAPKFSSRSREPMGVQVRQRKAREMVAVGKFAEAVPHLARVAASTGPFAHMARRLLGQAITALCQNSGPWSISRKLIRSVRNQSIHSWIRPSDLECVICTGTLRHPVTTPCGHSYCRCCLERSMSNLMKCALCFSPLKDFRMDDTSDNQFLKSLLSSIEVIDVSENESVIPIVTCYVAFPGMPCPLFISDPKYWQMVRRVTESGSRKFGMVAYEEGNTNADYGTVLEICDCVVFEDNRCILSTIGVSRFKIMERFVRDGCDLARVGLLSDTLPTADDIPDILLLNSETLFRALKWVRGMDESVQMEIETAFGCLPYVHTQEFWETANGPHWLWWVIAILPLKSEIKTLMISTCSLAKRMLAVSRTFDVMNVELDND